MNTATEIQLYFEDSNLKLNLSKDLNGHYLHEVARHAWINWMTAYSFGREHKIKENILPNNDIKLMAFNDCPDDWNSLDCKRSWMDGYLSGVSASQRAIKQSLSSLRFKK